MGEATHDVRTGNGKFLIFLIHFKSNEMWIHVFLVIGLAPLARVLAANHFLRCSSHQLGIRLGIKKITSRFHPKFTEV
jgi:hypothetical protein